MKIEVDKLSLWRFNLVYIIFQGDYDVINLFLIDYFMVLRSNNPVLLIHKSDITTGATFCPVAPKERGLTFVFSLDISGSFSSGVVWS